MAGTQAPSAITMAFSLAGIPRSAKPNALGIVVQADHASLGSQAASEETTEKNGKAQQGARADCGWRGGCGGYYRTVERWGKGASGSTGVESPDRP